MDLRHDIGEGIYNPLTEDEISDFEPKNEIFFKVHDEFSDSFEEEYDMEGNFHRRSLNSLYDKLRTFDTRTDYSRFLASYISSRIEFLSTKF